MQIVATLARGINHFRGSLAQAASPHTSLRTLFLFYRDSHRADVREAAGLSIAAKVLKGEAGRSGELAGLLGLLDKDIIIAISDGLSEKTVAGAEVARKISGPIIEECVKRASMGSLAFREIALSLPQDSVEEIIAGSGNDIYLMIDALGSGSGEAALNLVRGLNDQARSELLMRIVKRLEKPSTLRSGAIRAARTLVTADLVFRGEPNLIMLAQKLIPVTADKNESLDLLSILNRKIKDKPTLALINSVILNVPR